MSIASDTLLKETVGRLASLENRVAAQEKMIVALKLKLDMVENLTVPRTKRTPRDPETSTTRSKEWAQPTIP